MGSAVAEMPVNKVGLWTGAEDDVLDDAKLLDVPSQSGTSICANSGSSCSWEARDLPELTLPPRCDDACRRPSRVNAQLASPISCECLGQSKDKSQSVRSHPEGRVDHVHSTSTWSLSSKVRYVMTAGHPSPPTCWNQKQSASVWACRVRCRRTLREGTLR